MDPHVKMPNFTAEINMFLPLDAIKIILDIVRFHLHDNGLGSAPLLVILGLNVFGRVHLE